jgi:glycosidase
MTRLNLCALFLTALAAAAAPKIEKVEPPNWWVPHTLNPVQILLTGQGLKGSTVTTASPGFKIEVRSSSDDGRYLFLYLDIAKGVHPGSFKFQVKNASGTGEFSFALDRPIETKGRFQGFTSADVIYLIMPDRFANGDAGNDNPPGFNGPSNRQSPRAYHGGDLRGIRDRLSYLKDLGVTGFWLTPIYRNSLPSGGNAYHGYHAVDFYDVEPHFGTMQDMRELVDAAHGMGLKVVQDQVANHCGPQHPFVAHPPTKTWFNYQNANPHPRNNFDIAGLTDPYSRPARIDLPLRGWFAGNLPDFNQDDPLVADYLTENALWWIGMTGVDAVRQDTYAYVGRPFWAKWQSAIDKQYPGFTVVGEVTAPNPASLSFFEGGTAHAGIDTKLPSLLDFPLASAARAVFGQGQPMNRLVEILAQDSLYKRPDMLVTFPGNHDQPRLLTVAKDDIHRLMMNEAFTLTTRRVAHLYYGDEIAMTGGNDPDNRRDFPGGFPSDPINDFTPSGRTGDAATVFNFTRELLHFRRAHPALQSGDLTELLINQDQYAYLRSSRDERVLVVLNRAGSAKAIQIEVDDLGMPDGMHLKSFAADSPDAVVAGEKITIEQPKEFQIYWTERVPRR